jgi:hypothetical protein
MGDLPALLPNATPLVSRFFGEMSTKHQFKSNGFDFNFEKKFSILAKFTDISSNFNNYPRTAGKMSFTIEDKALIIDK